MKNITERLALFGFGLVAITLAVALTFGFIELLSHVDLGRLGADASRSSTTDMRAGSTAAALVESLGLFETLAHWLVALAGVVGVLVLPMVGLVLLGVGGTCLHGSIVGLPKPAVETAAETAADAEPVIGVSSLLRRFNPAFLS